jgi:hydrogenase/urease accessory protein HupE
MAIRPELPAGCIPEAGPEPKFDGIAWTSVWLANCTSDLAGKTIMIDGLDRTSTDVLVKYDMAEGGSAAFRLTATDPSVVLPDVPSRAEVVATYGGLGVTHILAGADHLLFVLALILLIRDRRRLVMVITAFTVGHSMSLALATLGWLIVPAPPVEAVIALSILFLARELVLPADPQTNLSDRRPWLVALGFGFLHGLGFARALLDIGLPPKDVPLALLMFNLGVELGQLLFIATVLVIGMIGVRLGRMFAGDFAWRIGLANRVLGFGIGGIAAFWLVERVAAF